jgi:hypothetical protein
MHTIEAIIAVNPAAEPTAEKLVVILGLFLFGALITWILTR